MIRYRDFVPHMLQAPGLFRSGDYESFDTALEAMNDWLRAEKVRLVNVETVVLPNIWSRWEEGSSDVALGTSGEMPSHWHQFIRCWYEE